MMAFKAWVEKHAPAVPPKSALGKALGYTLNQWDKLSRFLDHPEVPAHNNRVENEETGSLRDHFAQVSVLPQS